MNSTSQQRPTKIAKYEIKRRIGRGSMGVVYEAFDPFVQRTVAIKVAHSQDGQDEAHKLREHKRLDALLAYCEAASCRRTASSVTFAALISGLAS